MPSVGKASLADETKSMWITRSGHSFSPFILTIIYTMLSTSIYKMLATIDLLHRGDDLSVLVYVL